MSILTSNKYQQQEETWKSLKEEPEQEEVGEMVDQNENSIKCVNKAMELPLVSGQAMHILKLTEQQGRNIYITIKHS